MYIVLAILCLAAAFFAYITFKYFRKGYGWATLFPVSLILLYLTFYVDGNVKEFPVERGVFQVKNTTNGDYSVRHIIAFGQLVPLVGVDRNALSGMRVDWGAEDVIDSRDGDTLYVYRMKHIDSKFLLLKDTTEFLHINKNKTEQHEYDLFLHLLESGINEEIEPSK